MRLPDVKGDKPKHQTFKRNPTGLFRIDIADGQTSEPKPNLFVGNDRTSRFAVAQPVAAADRKTARAFLQHIFEALSIRVTHGWVLFAKQPRNRNAINSRPIRRDMICKANDIKRRLNRPRLPRTDGQVARMNRTSRTLGSGALTANAMIRCTRTSPQS